MISLNRSELLVGLVLDYLNNSLCRGDGMTGMGPISIQNLLAMGSEGKPLSWGDKPQCPVEDMRRVKWLFIYSKPSP